MWCGAVPVRCGEVPHGAVLLSTYSCERTEQQSFRGTKKALAHSPAHLAHYAHPRRNCTTPQTAPFVRPEASGGVRASGKKGSERLRKQAYASADPTFDFYGDHSQPLTNT